MSSITHQDETPEELQIRVDAIVKKNTLHGTCITCGFDIVGDTPMLDTIHGLYHDAPYPCVNGRD